MPASNHSYEELRAVALELLAGRQQPGAGQQYEQFKRALDEALSRLEHRTPSSSMSSTSLSSHDSELFMELFWDLFRQGFITLGLNDSNRAFPFFRVTAVGRKMLEGNPYFFHDLSSYEQVVREQVPDIDDVTLLYLKEAMQAFLSGCLLSSAVMVGVATEHRFELMLGLAASGPNAGLIEPILRERFALRRINRFKDLVAAHVELLAEDTREDLDTNLLGVMSLIRNQRNEAGHPSGRVPSREQCYVLLNLFGACAKKMSQLSRDLA